MEKIAAVPETSWSATARVTFPPTGGQIKLLVQNDTLKAVLKGAIDLALHEIAFKEGYTDIVSRGAYARRLLRLAAKAYGPRGEDIEKRAKKDTTFCTLLAPLVRAFLSFEPRLINIRFALGAVISGTHSGSLPPRRSQPITVSTPLESHLRKFDPS